MRRLVSVALAAVLLFTGCQKEEYNYNGITKGKGAISLNLSGSGSFTEPLVRSANVDVSGFFVKILKNDIAVASYNKYSDVPSAIELAPGTYQLEAGTPGGSDAAFDLPVYYGKSEPFTVEVGEIANVALVCTLSNVKVTIKCTETFMREINPNFEIAATNGKGNLVFNKSIVDAGTSGYFTPGTITLRLTATRVLDNSEVLHSYTIPESNAQDHHIVTFDAQETGSISFGGSGITVDYTLNDVITDIVIPGETETPVDPGKDPEPEEPENPGPADEYLPLITGNGIENSPIGLSQSAGESALLGMVVDIDIATQNGKTINDILVTISSSNTGFISLIDGMGLGGEFSIVNFSDANGEARKAMLMELGLIQNPAEAPIKGKMNYKFSIGSFMYPLSIATEVDDTVNFSIKVVDSEQKEVSAACVVNVKE